MCGGGWGVRTQATKQPRRWRAARLTGLLRHAGGVGRGALGGKVVAVDGFEHVVGDLVVVGDDGHAKDENVALLVGLGAREANDADKRALFAVGELVCILAVVLLEVKDDLHHARRVVDQVHELRRVAVDALHRADNLDVSRRDAVHLDRLATVAILSVLQLLDRHRQHHLFAVHLLALAARLRPAARLRQEARVAPCTHVVRAHGVHAGKPVAPAAGVAANRRAILVPCWERGRRI